MKGNVWLENNFSGNWLLNGEYLEDIHMVEFIEDGQISDSEWMVKIGGECAVLEYM